MKTRPPGNPPPPPPPPPPGGPGGPGGPGRLSDAFIIRMFTAVPIGLGAVLAVVAIFGGGAA